MSFWRRFQILDYVAMVIILALLLFVAFPRLFATSDPISLHLEDRLMGPSLSHPFGTDEGGRDLFSRVVYGTRYSLGVSVAVVFAAAMFGTLFGAVSGLVGGRIDNVMMRIVDLGLAFPLFVLAMAVAASIGPGLSTVVLALSIIWWPSYARLVRGEVLALRNHPHVEAARALGVRGSTLLRRHILPFVVGDLIVRVTVDVGYSLLAVTALCFLGLGAMSPTPEWGLLIMESKDYTNSAWWYMLFPGVMVVLATVAFSVLGDAFSRRKGQP